MAVLEVLLVDEVGGVGGVHHDDDGVLNALLAEGEHKLLVLLGALPLLCLVDDEGGEPLDTLELCGLVTAGGFDTHEDDFGLGAEVLYAVLLDIEVLGGAVALDLLQHLGDNGLIGTGHGVATEKDLLPLLEGESLDVAGDLVRFPTATASRDEDDELIIIEVEGLVYAVYGCGHRAGGVRRRCRLHLPFAVVPRY